jgi:heme-degrading monooxygenase HmoA
VIARIWRGWVNQADREAYVRYMDGTGLAEYASTPGSRGAYMLTRDQPDGRSEVLMVTFWDSMESVRAFAGADPERAVFYPEDDRFLVDYDETVTHYDVPSSR